MRFMFKNTFEHLKKIIEHFLRQNIFYISSWYLFEINVKATRHTEWIQYVYSTTFKKRV